MTNALTTTQDTAAERALIDGDLSALNPEQRLAYYKSVCESLGLNPLTKPFAYIKLNGKLTLYALKDATDQLRALRGVSITKLERERIDDIYAVTAYATDAKGRSDSSIGAVTIGNMRGDALANALMKAETKAKRRVTMSICGLGMLDETEIETIPTTVVEQTKVISQPTSSALGEWTEELDEDPEPPKPNGNGVKHNSTTFWAKANELGMKAEASRIIKQHTSQGVAGNVTDWNAAYVELNAVAMQPA